jgi:methyl-accepting chemotaxis protein
MTLRSLSIAPRATLCFALVSLLVIVLGVFSLLELGRMRAAHRDVQQNWLVSLDAVDTLQRNLILVRLETIRLAVDPAKAAQTRATLQQLLGTLENDFAAYRTRYARDRQEQQLVQAAGTALERYRQNVADLLGLPSIEQQVAFINADLRDSAAVFLESLRALRTFNHAGIEAAGEHVEATYRQGQLAVWTSIGIAVLLTLVLAWLLTRSLVRPLTEALTTAERIAQGDLTGRIQTAGRDEPARLLAALARMRDHLADAIRQIAHSSTQLAAAAEQMAAVTDESTRGLQSQHAEVEQAAAAVNQMSAAVDEVSRNASAASDAARASSQSALDGNRHVGQTVSAIRGLSERVRGTSEQVSGLAAQAQDISKVLDVIRGIAEQTNLLALNAAIEAARAGEQGRGFAVVADEVRALAHRTAASTQEIEQMISRIQTGTEGAVAAMHDSSEEAGRTLAMADEAGRSLEAIVAAIGQINERNLQIATASEEQAHVAREVDRSLVSIRDLSIQSASGANQTAAACSDLARLAQELNQLVLRFQV